MQYFWKKKVIVSYILSCFVLLIHISSYSQYSRDLFAGGIETFNAVFTTFFTDTFVKIAVPLFFIISGCLFFRNCKNIKNVFIKMKSRVFTLLIPFLIWNIIIVIFNVGNWISFFKGRKIFEIFEPSLKNIFLTIFYAQNNGPFWFIFALIIFVIFSPIIFYIIKNKYFALMFLLVLLVLHQFKINFSFPNFARTDSFIIYFFGCIIGKYYFNLFSKKIKTNQSLIFLFIFLLCLMINILYAFEIIKMIYIIDTIFYIVFALSFWYLCDLFIEKMKQYEFYNHSFYVFAMHSNIQAPLGIVIWKILPKKDYFSIVNYFLDFIITLLIINYMCVFLKRYMPKIYILLGGGRG